ncbi:hypothetical protein IWQ57_006054, partial [Coemansia nantahalensis]
RRGGAEEEAQAQPVAHAQPAGHRRRSASGGARRAGAKVRGAQDQSLGRRPAGAARRRGLGL